MVGSGAFILILFISMTEVAISVQVYEKKDQYIVNSEVLSWHNFLGT